MLEFHTSPGRCENKAIDKRLPLVCAIIRLEPSFSRNPNTVAVTERTVSCSSKVDRIFENSRLEREGESLKKNKTGHVNCQEAWRNEPRGD